MVGEVLDGKIRNWCQWWTCSKESKLRRTKAGRPYFADVEVRSGWGPALKKAKLHTRTIYFIVSYIIC